MIKSLLNILDKFLKLKDFYETDQTKETRRGKCSNTCLKVSLMISLHFYFFQFLIKFNVLLTF